MPKTQIISNNSNKASAGLSISNFKINDIHPPTPPKKKSLKETGAKYSFISGSCIAVMRSQEKLFCKTENLSLLILVLAIALLSKTTLKPNAFHRVDCLTLSAKHGKKLNVGYMSFIFKPCEGALKIKKNCCEWADKKQRGSSWWLGHVRSCTVVFHNRKASFPFHLAVLSLSLAHWGAAALVHHMTALVHHMNKEQQWWNQITKLS